MLEKPDLQDEKVIAWLEDEFELAVSKFDFLPLGPIIILLKSNFLPNNTIETAYNSDKTQRE